MNFHSHLSMWGNSLALRIPKAFAHQLQARDGMPVTFSVQNGSLVVTPVSSPELTLAQLLMGITEENLHGETSTGFAVGNEIVE